MKTATISNGRALLGIALLVASAWAGTTVFMIAQSALYDATGITAGLAHLKAMTGPWRILHVAAIAADLLVTIIIGQWAFGHLSAAAKGIWAKTPTGRIEVKSLRDRAEQLGRKPIAIQIATIGAIGLAAFSGAYATFTAAVELTGDIAVLLTPSFPAQVTIGFVIAMMAATVLLQGDGRNDQPHKGAVAA